MSAARVRHLVLLALGAAAAAVAALVLLNGDGEDYMVRLEIDNASGVREGRPVRIGGAEAGKVEDLDLGRGDVVHVDLALDPDEAEVGRGASAQIKPTNLLGERFVDLDPGDLSDPQPSGVVIPDSRVAKAVDLDQVVDVLDADTRTRLGILINEAGLAFTGREADFNAILKGLPRWADKATNLLNELVSDNQTLGSLIERGQGFISRLTEERADLSRAIDSAGETMRTVSARRDQLRETLERAPGALSTLRRFLAELRVTTGPLAPAARAISSTAPDLESTLAELEPFRQAAEPAFEQATAVAPELTRLGIEATPVLRRSNPTLRSLTRFARELDPVTQSLHRGTGVNKVIAPGPIDDLLSVIHTWARAIQGRDGTGHVFNGYVFLNTDQIRRFLEPFEQEDAAKESQRAKRAERPSESAPKSATGAIGELLPQVDALRRALDDATKKLGLPERLRDDLRLPERLRLLRDQKRKGGGPPPLTQLLDFMLKP